jgi:SAM-dependent methyltransferase
MNVTYDDEFFADIAVMSRSSASRIAPIVMNAVCAASVVDVGCGTGLWLSEFTAAGARDILGVDGARLGETQLAIPATSFMTADLTRPLRLERRFDLALSLELAEHLPPERSESLVDELVALAPAVLFSAAIPGQTGTEHINERWQDEWAAMFAAHGYRCVDLIRSVVWDDERVAPWYAQNTLLYLAPDREIPQHVALPLRVVHPRLFAERLAAEQLEQRTLGEIAHVIPTAARRWLRHHIAPGP